MTERRALIIANSVSYGERSKNVPPNVVRSVVADLSTQLENLGEHSFSVTTAVDETASALRKTAAKAIKQAGTDGSLLLIYYFGHGVQSETGEDLFLYLKESDWQDETTMVKLGDLVAWMRAFKVRRALLILDCCHAGMISKNLRILETYGGKYYLMAAVTAKDKALVDYNDSRPIGAFSRFVLAGFTNAGARVSPTRTVTFKSFFSFAEARTLQKSNQAPYSQDGGLAEGIFFKQATKPQILPAVRATVPPKSLYMKIYALGTFLSIKEFAGVDDLYRLILKARPRQFLTPIKEPDGSLNYQVIGKATFGRYVLICRRLGIVEEDQRLLLSPIGKRMYRKDGAQFNATLYGLLVDAWSQFSITIDDIVDVIAERLRRSSIPTSDAIWFDMYLAKKLFMPKWLFQEMLDLTGFVGAVNLSRERTFFLAAQSEGTVEALAEI